MEQNILNILEWLAILMFILWPRNISKIVSATSAIIFSRYYLDQWAGSGTARYRKESEKGSLWWGYNKRTGSVFLHYDGSLGFSRIRHFQLRNWRPRFVLRLRR